MSRPGWIKLFNQMLDSDIWMIDQPFSYRDAFIHVLLSANWRPGITNRNGHTLQVKRGQWLTSIRKLGATFHWDKHKVYKWLEFMSDAGIVTSESVGFGTLLTVVNYEKFQNDGDTVTHTPTHEVAHTPTHTVTHEVAPRSKTKDIRQQTEDNISACAEEPAAPDPEDDDDEGWMSPEEAIRLWESTHSDAKMPLN